jgi:hypothetical protein
LPTLHHIDIVQISGPIGHTEESAIPISVIPAVLIGLFVSACSLASAINADVFDYFNVNDLASNRVILLNILRAKDSSPLHFGELSQIRGQLSANASASSTFPFGPKDRATTLPRNLATAGIGVSISPSFDITSLDEQDFTKGVMTPITPGTAEFFLNEGIDYRLVLILLASGIRLAGNSEMLLNVPNSSRKVCYDHTLLINEMPTKYQIISSDEPCAGESEREFYGFLRVVNHIGRLFTASFKERRPVGPPFVLDMKTQLRAIASIDPAKYTLSRLQNGQYQIFAATHAAATVLCRESGHGDPPRVVSVFDANGEANTPIPERACIAESGANDPSLPEARPAVLAGSTPGTFVIRLRSTLEIIRYAGQLLAFQEEQTKANGIERCVTLTYRPISGPTCNGGTVFNLAHSILPTESGIAYGGNYWSLPEPHACTQAEVCDHTLETMAMISLLLNQNKSAKEISTTPAVQAVP